MAVAATEEKVCVVATRPKVPVADLEEICGVSIIWVDKNEKTGFRAHFSETPSIFFQAGWYVKHSSQSVNHSEILVFQWFCCRIIVSPNLNNFWPILLQTIFK